MARPTLLALHLFETVFRPWMRRRVHVRMAGLPVRLVPGLPLLIVANHVSWWDGFILREVHRAVRPRAPLRVVMTERELRRNRVLGWIAAVPIEPGSPTSVLSTFRGLRRLRDAEPDSVVLFFPQGRIWPSYQRPLGFERGVSTLARMLSPVQVLPVGIHVEPLTSVRPTIFAAAAPVIRVPHNGRIHHAVLEAIVEGRLDAIRAFVARHGERSDVEWPGSFRSLPGLPAGPPARVHASPRLRLVPRDPERRKG